MKRLSFMHRLSGYAARIAAIALAATLMTTPRANAALMLDLTGSAGQSFICSSCTFGYDFTLNSGTTIRAMGIFDHDANGLAGPHQVGLWNASGGLLRSTTIDNSSVAVNSGPLNTRWLFENISEIALGAGTYFVGMTQPTTGQDRGLLASVAFNFDGVKGSGRFGGFNQGGLTLAFPANTSNFNGVFGPNLSSSYVGTIPLPGALGLLLLGLTGLGFVSAGRRRRTSM